MNEQEMKKMDMFKLEQLMHDEQDPITKLQMQAVIDGTFMKQVANRRAAEKVAHIGEVKENTKGQFIAYPISLLTDEILADNRCYNTMYTLLLQSIVRGPMKGDKGEVYHRYLKPYNILATVAGAGYLAQRFGYSENSREIIRGWKDRLIELKWVQCKLIKSQNNTPITVYILGKREKINGRWKEHYLSENPNMELYGG